MTTERFTTWFDAYAKSWIEQDDDLLLEIFTEDGTYMYTPFHPLMEGREAIRAYAEKGSESLQSDVHFAYEILAVQEPYAIARATADFLWEPTGDRIRFDGIYIAYLDADGLCYRFDEWWHCDPQLPDENAPDA